MGVAITAAVEGPLDEAVVRRLVTELDGVLGPVHGLRGKTYLRQRVVGFNAAAAHAPWLVLVDLDNEECAAALRADWLPAPSSGLCFRVAVREVEAWLLADRDGIARFLGVSVSRIPQMPEAQADPKRLIVNLARSSRRRDVRDGLVPRPESGRAVGPEYMSMMSDFAGGAWRPEVAEGVPTACDAAALV